MQSTQASWIGASSLLPPESEACCLCAVTFAINSTKMGEGISGSRLSTNAAYFLSNIFFVRVVVCSWSLCRRGTIYKRTVTFQVIKMEYFRLQRKSIGGYKPAQRTYKPVQRTYKRGQKGTTEVILRLYRGYTAVQG
jgi:hypothetical protein